MNSPDPSPSYLFANTVPSTLSFVLLAVVPIPTPPVPSIEKSELADPTLTVSNGLHAVVPTPTLSKLPSLINALALIAPNCAQLLSDVKTNPVVPPRGGSWLNTMSPGSVSYTHLTLPTSDLV